MTDKYDDNTLMAAYNKYAGHVFAKEQELKAELAKVRAAMDGIKADLMRRLIERGAQNTKTESGTAYLSEHLNVKVQNPEVLLRWAQESWDERGALINIKPPVEAVRDFMSTHEGKLPFGITTDTFTRINIKGKSNGA